ncbi:SDR family NAD(P)-dependent oxidoreductase [Enterovirga aerilata]|uniref:SDR family oxidoreductase n=1 Tax=Enterovirga aerilata TaxID=2730920 RepID=A0A849IDG7_9HYPH|nr:SDR family oxidoreductase [Enterovirga sp. DB1703]NNM74027.1 SDR family oxidoreductase [Enterovirga sp. DB1703]
MYAELETCGLRLTGKLLEGKRVLLTGAASPRGLGKATAALLVEHGAKVVIADIDYEAALRAVADVGAAAAVRFDARDPASCRQVVEDAVDHLGGLDGLVPMVGVTVGGAFDEITADQVDMLFDINARSTFLVIQAAVPHLKSGTRPAVVCMSSVAGQRGGGLYGTSAYSASKAAVNAIGKAYGRELAPMGIRVNTISPALINTDVEGNPNQTPEIRQGFEKLVPMGRSGSRWEVPGVVLFLLSDLSTFMAGATVDVNGGLHIH